MDVLVSVVIVNLNGKDLLDPCLNSIFSKSASFPFEIIVVDNNSKDDSVSWLRNNYPDVITIHNTKNLGFSRANNQGIRQAKGKYILLLNNDTEFLNNALKPAVEHMEQNSDVGICGLKLLHPDGSIQYSCRSFPGFATSFFNRYSFLTRLFPDNIFSRQYLKTDFKHDKIADVDWVSGAAMLLRREMLGQIGLLDDRFFMYSEDVDICYRAWQNKWRVVYFPESQIVHHIGQTTLNDTSLFIPTLWHRHKSMFLFFKKHYSRHFFLVDWFTLLAILVRFIFLATTKTISGSRSP